MKKLTTEQTKIVEHSLGLTRADEPYRNRYYTYRGGDNYDMCMELVKEGIMKRHKTDTDHYFLFQVTDYGKTLIV